MRKELQPTRPESWRHVLRVCLGGSVLQRHPLGPGALCVGARRSLCRAQAPFRHSESEPGTLSVSVSGSVFRRVPPGPAGPQLRSACHPSGPAGPNSDLRATHPARRVPFFQERTPNLTGWGLYSKLDPPNSFNTKLFRTKRSFTNRCPWTKALGK